MVFLVAPYRPHAHDGGYDEEREELVGYAVEAAATDEGINGLVSELIADHTIG